MNDNNNDNNKAKNIRCNRIAIICYVVIEMK